MAAKFFEVEHGTEQWRAWRCGKITASRFLEMLATGTGSPWGQPALRYAEELCVEITTGKPFNEGMDAPALRWGREQEPNAREEYILARTAHVVKPNLVYYREGMFAGGSPDGLVNPNGGTEFKCPKDPRVHFETVTRRTIPTHHIPQVQGYMWLTERDWWDFVSYDPRHKPGPPIVNTADQYITPNLFIHRVRRSDPFIMQLSTRVLAFQELIIDKLKKFGYDGNPFDIQAPAPVEPLADPGTPSEENAPAGQP